MLFPMNPARWSSLDVLLEVIGHLKATLDEHLGQSWCAHEAYHGSINECVMTTGIRLITHANVDSEDRLAIPLIYGHTLRHTLVRYAVGHLLSNDIPERACHKKG
jgi:hypothetical protein